MHMMYDIQYTMPKQTHITKGSTTNNTIHTNTFGIVGTNAATCTGAAD